MTADSGGTAAEGAKNVLLLSTEKKVYGFNLLDTFRVAMGRHASNDLSFDSRNVSNYHAEILNEVEGLVLRDLGSTNGTYVNEERVRMRKLSHGDRIRIGNHEILVKLTNDEGASDAKPEMASIAQKGGFRRAGGENGGLTLKGVLLGFCRQGESLHLILARNQQDTIDVYIHDGRVIYAESGTAKAEKALYRAFEWHTGKFRTEPFPANDSIPRAMSIPIETLVEEGEQQADEIDEILGKLPPPEAPLRLRETCKMRICDFTPAEMEIFQALIRGGSLGRAMEESPMTDLRVMSQVHALLRKKVFEVEENSSLLEQTNIITRH